MQAIDIIHEIERLPLTKKFYIVEETLKSIKKEETHHQLDLAATALYDDYAKDEQLIAFTKLDFDNFYEAK